MQPRVQKTIPAVIFFWHREISSQRFWFILDACKKKEKRSKYLVSDMSKELTAREIFHDHEQMGFALQSALETNNKRVLDLAQQVLFAHNIL